MSVEEKGVGPEVVMGMMRCEEPHPLLTAAGPGVEDCSSSLLHTLFLFLYCLSEDLHLALYF